MSDMHEVTEKLRTAYEDWRNADTTAQLHADPEDYDAQALAEAAEEAAWAWDQAASLFMLNADAILALIQKEQGWRDGPPPTEPDNKAWMVHRDGWKHGKIAKYSAGAWWIDGNRYSPHLPFDRHCEPPTPPQGEDET